MARMECADAGAAFLAAGEVGERSAVVAFRRRPEVAKALGDYARRQDLAGRLNAAADRCLENPDMRAMWRRKALQATYLPSAELTGWPRSAPVDFSPDLDPPARSNLWLIWLLLLVAAAIAVTPVPV